MPVRRKIDRRRTDVVTALRELFATGVDWDQDARAFGVSTNLYDFPTDPAQVQALWRQHGRQFLESYRDPHLDPWALREFGDP